MVRFLEHRARAAILGSVALAARCPLPATLDPVMGAIAARLVRIYRASLSYWLGRQCLFHPTCSERALGYLGAHGWTKGVQLTHEQLSRCRGNFTLHLTSDDRMELVAADGEVFPQSELSPHLLSRFGPQCLPGSGFLRDDGGAEAATAIMEAAIRKS